MQKIVFNFTTHVAPCRLVSTGQQVDHKPLWLVVSFEPPNANDINCYQNYIDPNLSC